MDARLSFRSPYQDSQDSTTPQPSVLIVEDVEAAARELRAEHEANNREIRYHLRQAQAALATTHMVIDIMANGSDEDVKNLVQMFEPTANVTDKIFSPLATGHLIH